MDVVYRPLNGFKREQIAIEAGSFLPKSGSFGWCHPQIASN